MATNDKGKWAEKSVRDYLEGRSARQAGFAFHRFPDARAARGAVPAQPADFLVGYGGAVHLEVKETAQVRRLPKAKISQYGKLKMFNDAGFETVVLIYRSAANDWTYLTGLDLFEHEECPASFAIDDKPTYPTAAAALDHYFG